MKLSQVIDELVEESGMDRSLLNRIICEGMQAAYHKKYPDLDIVVSHNKKNDELEITVKKIVATSVADEDMEISLRKARNIKEDVEVGQELWVPFTEPIGRIEILRAKQFIATEIRKAEAAIVYNAFIDKKGTVVLGTIHKCERNGMAVKIGDVSAFLPKSRSLQTDKCIVGYTIKALLLDVLPEPRSENQLILDRTSIDFVKRLFELEIPEVFEKLVEIKVISRIAGYKTKIAVISHDKNIDPVGTCIGVGGVRIKPVLKELGTEKIDVFVWSSSPEELIARALKPAVVNRVEIVDNNIADVWVDEDQRSVAIGRAGQNIALASQLTGYTINLVQTSDQQKKETLHQDLSLIDSDSNDFQDEIEEHVIEEPSE